MAMDGTSARAKKRLNKIKHSKVKRQGLFNLSVLFLLVNMEINYFYGYYGHLTLWTHQPHFADTSLRGHLTSRTPHFADTSLRGHLTSRIPHFADTSLRGHFTSRIPHFADTSLRGHLTSRTPHFADTSLRGHLTSRTPHFADTSETGHTSQTPRCTSQTLHCNLLTCV